MRPSLHNRLNNLLVISTLHGFDVGRAAQSRALLIAGGRRSSTLLVGVEDVVLRLHDRMARVSAI